MKKLAEGFTNARRLPESALIHQLIREFAGFHEAVFQTDEPVPKFSPASVTVSLCRISWDNSRESIDGGRRRKVCYQLNAKFT